MTPIAEIACSTAAVKSHLLDAFSRGLDECLAAPPKTSAGAETTTWEVVLSMGRELLTALLTLACRRTFEAATADVEQVRLRLDDDYSLAASIELLVEAVARLDKAG